MTLRRDKSLQARELIMDAIKFKMVLSYQQGKTSLGTLAQKLGMTLSEALDLLADLGIPAPLSFDDYLAGNESLRKLF